MPMRRQKRSLDFALPSPKRSRFGFAQAGPLGMTAKGRLFGGCRSGHGDLGVLVAQHTGDADGTDDLAIDHDRHAAFQRRDALDGEQPEIDPALGDAVL